jgi:hypothetical protein
MTTYPLISDLFKNSNSLAVVTEIIHLRLFGQCYHCFKCYHLFEPTVMFSVIGIIKDRVDRRRGHHLMDLSREGAAFWWTHHGTGFMYNSEPHTILSVKGTVGSAQATRHEIIGLWQQNPARVENWALPADDLCVPTVRSMKILVRDSLGNCRTLRSSRALQHGDAIRRGLFEGIIMKNMNCQENNNKNGLDTLTGIKSDFSRSADGMHMSLVSQFSTSGIYHGPAIFPVAIWDSRYIVALMGSFFNVCRS